MNEVVEYQKAFNTLIDRFKKDENIAAVLVFGSMVSGDFWEESDLDVFAIVYDKLDRVKNIYAEINQIPIHIRVVSKDDFMNLQNQQINKGRINRLMASSKLIFSKDDDVAMIYNQGRFYPDNYKEIYNLVHFSRVLSYLAECKKYLSNDNIPNAYCIAVKCVNDFAKLYVNYNGYSVTRDALTMCLNTNEEFERVVNQLFFNQTEIRENIQIVLEFINKEINNNLKVITKLLLDFIKEKDSLLSTEDIKENALFSKNDIDIERILNKLWQKKIISKNTKEYYNSNDELLFEQNVYFMFRN